MSTPPIGPSEPPPIQAEQTAVLEPIEQRSATPWLVLIAVLSILLTIGAVYLLVSDDSGDTRSAADTSSAGTSSATASDEPDEEEQSQESTSTKAGPSGLPTPTISTKPSPKPSTKPSTKPRPSAASAGTCTTKPGKAQTQNGQMVRSGTISCTEPTRVIVEPVAGATITVGSDTSTKPIKVCVTKKVTVTAVNGTYRITEDGPC